MAEALRAALRLLPVVRSAPVQAPFGACSRASAVRKKAPENHHQQSLLLSVPAPQQQAQVSVCERESQSVTGLARFARSVLAYVGVGVSTVAAIQITGPTVVHGRELGDSDTMAAAEARAVWQRTAANRLIQEDTVRAPKLAHCPSQKAQDSHSFYLSNSWGSMDTKVDLPRQLSPSSHRDYRSEYLGLEEVLGSRFKPGLQALAAERGNMKSGSPGYMSVAPEYSVGSELDIGWQFVVDPKPKSGNSIASEITESDKHPEANDATLSDEECDAVVVARETTCESNMTQNIMSKNEKGLVDVISNPTLGSREKTLKKVDSMVSRQSGDGLLAPIKTPARTSPTKMGHSWRTADKEALAALVAQKTAEKLENCDLPAPRSESVCKTPLESWEMMVESPSQISQSLDRELLASIFQGGEPSRFESSALPTSPLLYSAPESHSTPSLPAKVSQPLNISSGPANATTHRLSHSYSSTDHRNTSWSGGGGVAGSSLGKGSSPLGEALCHSQTRAREAEQQAEQKTKDYKKLSHLFFREASLSLTYRQWVCSLQAENAWLKLYIRNHHGDVWLQHSFLSPFAVLERLSKNQWSKFGQEHLRRQMHFSAVWSKKDPPTDDAAPNPQDTHFILGCTIGFAFALGLSLAGAGLVLGWSMGWILLPY